MTFYETSNEGIDKIRRDLKAADELEEQKKQRLRDFFKRQSSNVLSEEYRIPVMSEASVIYMQSLSEHRKGNQNDT